MTSSPTPPETPAEPPRKPANNSWILTAGGGLIGVYFLVNGALMIRDEHGDGIFALLMAGIVVLVTTLAVFMFKTYRAERAPRD
ncbi:hypothetical protein [Actinoplanes utahensis]|uniref:Uncharacterized protein n=1 Tax=Actinoplanes utahensis TaxID=1869 RepID=A0A0A6XCU9_ACTUT|nr:hypothetical protein [Actinoplanes utahensis]KHD77882.1 hypothetical protein MB27_08895 [Actinoplanes utahensis]